LEILKDILLFQFKPTQQKALCYVPAKISFWGVRFYDFVGWGRCFGTMHKTRAKATLNFMFFKDRELNNYIGFIIFGSKITQISSLHTNKIMKSYQNVLVV
jgi:hypothetical protein